MPLNHVATTQFSGGIAEFRHYNLDRNINVLGSLENLDNTIPVTLEIKDKLDLLDWPDGVHYELGGEYEEQQSTFGNLGIILILAQIAIFAVLVLQFRSILQPLIVFAAIPLAITGSFLALFLTGWSFSFFAFVGLISLIGIVVNNSIILVDYINQLRDEGEELISAIVKGSTRRFKPIVLTTITTILGLIPLATGFNINFFTLFSEFNPNIYIGGDNVIFWGPLAKTVIYGLIIATFLTLIVVPILFFLATKLKMWLYQKRAQVPAEPASTELVLDK